jgi:hypothetical protein
MGTDGELKEFLAKWRSELRRDSPKRLLWEGSAAFKELNSKNLNGSSIKRRPQSDTPVGRAISRARLEEHDPAGERIAEKAIGDICAELCDYRKSIADFRRRAVYFKKTEERLEQYKKQFAQWAENDDFSRATRNHFRKIANKIAIGRKQLADGQWQWPRTGLIDYYAQSSRTISGRPQQKRSLDTRFVQRLSAHFESALPKLTRRTIARLIVLFLYCANLAEEDKSVHGKYYLRLRHDKRPISVHLVLKKLHKLHQAASRGQSKDWLGPSEV